jgi:hypothetical protein
LTSRLPASWASRVHFDGSAIAAPTLPLGAACFIASAGSTMPVMPGNSAAISPWAIDSALARVAGIVLSGTKSLRCSTSSMRSSARPWACSAAVSTE